MKHFLRDHSLCAALLFLLLVVNALSWSMLFTQRVNHPDDTALFGTFGTSNIVNSAFFATFDEERFYLYYGQSKGYLDQGVWAGSNSKAILTGQAGIYDLVIHGNSIYLVGGEFDRIANCNCKLNTLAKR